MRRSSRQPAGRPRRRLSLLSLRAAGVARTWARARARGWMQLRRRRCSSIASATLGRWVSEMRSHPAAFFFMSLLPLGRSRTKDELGLVPLDRKRDGGRSQGTCGIADRGLAGSQGGGRSRKYEDNLKFLREGSRGSISQRVEGREGVGG